MEGEAEEEAAEVSDGPLPAAPARRVAIVACMDARLPPLDALGLALGDAHVIRNAGGIVTDDVIRSLAISQRKLGTTEIVLVHHTDCGMTSFTDAEFAAELEADAGEAPPFAIGAFADAAESVRESIRRLRRSPFLTSRDRIRGYVYDVESGDLAEVAPG